MQEKQTFYMNYATGGNSPTHKFVNLHEAEAEAHRLCDKLQCEVVTLMAVSSVKPASKYEATKYTEDLPF